jgi:hypothetical protein
MTRMRKRFLDCSGLDMAQAASFGNGLCEQQRDVMFQLGDLARYAEARWPDTWEQVFPEWVSPGMIARAAGVCRAYLWRRPWRRQGPTLDSFGGLTDFCIKCVVTNGQCDHDQTLANDLQPFHSPRPLFAIEAQPCFAGSSEFPLDQRCAWD